MNWSTPDDLRAQVERLWDRGELLRATVSDSIAWPLRLNLRMPGAADLADRFEAVRAWVRTLAEARNLRIEWREWKHRIQGTQQMPASIWIDTLADALDLINRSRQARRYSELWSATGRKQPALQAWLLRRPQQALDLADRWERLLAVVEWLQQHPRPAVYLRQIDAPGVDSKFVEANRGVLAELLDLALPVDAIDPLAAGAAQFTRRYGFLGKPVRIRLRGLDPALPALPGCHGLRDVTLDAESFTVLALPLECVFITENEANFLAFPAVERAIVIFGAGYGWDALGRAAWLRRCALHYWGDIDTHGYAILDRLRVHFPHAASFLMDRETLLAHRLQWGEEPEPARSDLSRLTTAEAALYDDLRFDRLQPRLRLEQERVGYGWLNERLPRPA